MKLKYKDTDFTIEMKKTNDRVGLSHDDYWCDVTITIFNEDFSYGVTRKSISKKELDKAIATLKRFIKDGKKETILFIKNFYITNLFTLENDKVMEINFISLVNCEKTDYSIYFKNEEIEEFINTIENLSVYH